MSAEKRKWQFSIEWGGTFIDVVGIEPDDEIHTLKLLSESPDYPDPFNPTTTIEFSLPISVPVTLTVYDILGREVEAILNLRLDAETHSVHWNAGNFHTGIYFVRTIRGEYT